MESPRRTGTGQVLALPHLWAPFLMLTVGLMVTGFTANTLQDHSRALAEEVYRKQHHTLVARLQGYNQPPPVIAGEPMTTTAVTDTSAVELWLATVFRGQVPGTLELRVDTLERHTKTPLFQASRVANPDPSRSLRSELEIGDHRWLVTTQPDIRFIEDPAQRSFRFVWLAGLLITLLATVVVIVLILRIRHWRNHYHSADRASEGLQQQLNSMQVEKSILRQVLNDSEQRSRDLVALSGATICELDENAVTGYVSPQMADLLQRAPTDLAGHPFEHLVDPASQDNFRKTLQAARQERQIQRIDLHLLDADQSPLPVTLRVLALQDTFHGFSGYRLSLQPCNHAG